MTKTRELEEQLYIIGLFALTFGGIGVLLYMFVLLPNVEMPPCALYGMFGIYCPGCGGTRAVDAMLHGHFLRSLWYHPLVLYTIVIFGTFMVTQTMERLKLFRVRGLKFRVWHMVAALVIMIVNCVVKNILLLCFHIKM